MTQPNANPVPAGIDFEIADDTPVVNGRGKRDEAAVTVSPSGYTKGNTETTEKVVQLLQEAGPEVNREKFRLLPGVNKDLGLISLYIASWNTKGAVPVRMTPNSITFHLGGLLKKYPTLRPSTKVEPEVAVITDAKGRRCIAFNILSALPKTKTRTSKNSNNTTSTETKAK